MKRGLSVCGISGLAALLLFSAGPLSAALAGDIVAEWSSVKPPPPPEPKAVTVDPKTTALLMLDFLQQNCGKRQRCLDEMPAMKKLLDAARAAGTTVIYSAYGNIPASDIIKDVAPRANEPLIHSHADKFLESDLDKMLKDKGIKTVITVGTAANGAVLCTATSAGLRGYAVIVPVDGLSGDPYGEQFSVWQLAHGPTFADRVTITRSNMIKF